jgi:purine-binding chemotaxis protein CheW
MTNYLLFLLAGQVFGVRLRGAIEILPRRAARTVPMSYSYVEGLLDYRGTVYPVFDLARRLGISCPGPTGFTAAETEAVHESQSILLLEECDMPFGIIADTVLRMTKLEEKPVSPEKVQGIDLQYVKGCVSDEDYEAMILDFERLFHAG